RRALASSATAFTPAPRDIPATNTVPALAKSPTDSMNRVGRRTVLRSAMTRPRSRPRIRPSRARTPVAALGFDPTPWWSIAARTVVRLALTSGARAIDTGRTRPAARIVPDVHHGAAGRAGAGAREPKSLTAEPPRP